MVTQDRHFIKSLAYNKQTLISNNLFVGKYNCDSPSQVLVYYPIDLTTLILVRLLKLQLSKLSYLRLIRPVSSLLG